MTLAILLARLALAPALLALAAWFVAQRRARPDLLTRWLAAKVVALLASLALLALTTALGPPALALSFVVLADGVAWFLAARLWTERRPVPLGAAVAAHEAARLAHAALDVAEAAERAHRRPRA